MYILAFRLTCKNNVVDAFMRGCMIEMYACMLACLSVCMYVYNFKRRHIEHQVQQAFLHISITELTEQEPLGCPSRIILALKAPGLLIPEFLPHLQARSGGSC